MRVIFIRHGESEYNTKNLINQNPRIKVHITSRGKEQAKETGKKLKGKKFDVIFVSEFLRTRETGKILNRFLNSKILTDKRINEWKVGFEGKHNDDLKRARKQENRFSFKLKGKESWHDLKSRVEKFVQYLKESRYKKVLVITHEAVVMCARSLILGITDEEAFARKIKNCEYFEFRL